VGGTEDQPLNTWRIVHLTPAKDAELIKRFESFRDTASLPKYIEVYIKKDLQANLANKDLP
jgi:hypothetical protein